MQKLTLIAGGVAIAIGLLSKPVMDWMLGHNAPEPIQQQIQSSKVLDTIPPKESSATDAQRIDDGTKGNSLGNKAGVGTAAPIDTHEAQGAAGGEPRVDKQPK